MKNCPLLLILLINLIPVQTNAQHIFIDLNKNWQFKNQKENKWYLATVPGTVHTDLLSNKLIPDPYYRDNESKLQWIDKEDWEHKTSFDVDSMGMSNDYEIAVQEGANMVRVGSAIFGPPPAGMVEAVDTTPDEPDADGDDEAELM